MEQTTSSELEQLTIVPFVEPSDEARSQRLSGFTLEERSFLELKSEAVAPYPQSEKDFLAQCTHTVTRTARVYTLDKHATKIIVPQDYAIALDEVRDLRIKASQSTLNAEGVEAARHSLAQHHLRNHVLPEDVVPLLDELPDSSLFRELFLLDWNNPRDVWLKQLYNSDTFVSAAGVNAEGEVEFYLAERNVFLRTNIFHEWTHRLEHRDKRFKDLFADALEMEWREFVPNTYALKSYSEHWAVVGEELMHFDGNRFMETARKAPIRTVVWMDALADALNAVPVERRSVFHKAFVNRISWCKSNIAPLAAKLLQAEIDRATRIQSHLLASKAEEPS